MPKARSQWELLRTTRPESAEEILGTLLANRKTDASFLNTALKDLEPYLNIQGMEEAAELTARHLSRGHKIVLVGDYDCDGITSVSQFSLFLKDIGYSSYAVVIPSRAEGYGMPERVVTDHSDARLFVAMDCGTMDVRAITSARSRGADCIVIDHHEVPAEGVAPANVLVNPKQEGCPSPFKEFCASGLTLLFLTKLRKAIAGKFPQPVLGEKYLALATLGTVADIVPLVEGNRIIAKAGLGHLSRTHYLPLRQIVDVAGLNGKTLTAGHIGYYLAPRINAAGRVSDARIAYELLISEDPEEIQKFAQELDRLNSRRQHQEALILKMVRERLTDELTDRRTLVLGDPAWSQGLVGIVASRVQQEIHYGPTILFAVDETKGVARGSARSVAGFDIYSALKKCGDLLIRWGGHKMAAGMTVALDKMKPFQDRFEEVAQEYDADVFVPKGKVDCELDLSFISPELLNILEQLEPYGPGNPAPVFAARNKKVSIQKTFGRDKNHLRLLVDDSIRGVFWKGVRHRQLGQWQDGERLDVVFQVEWDSFCGAPFLNIKDLGHFFPK